MQSMRNKRVLITGASSGFGKACAEQFAALGARLILSARRLERIEALAAELKAAHGVEVLAVQLDVQNKEQVAASLGGLPEAFKEVDVLVNNAGLALTSDKIQNADPANWDTMLNTNVHGLLYVTHAILPSMVARKSGHIINVGSIAGREVYPMGNVYSATKFAVRALSKAMREDLLGLNIRVTEIAPGAADTEFSKVRWDDQGKADEFYHGFEPLQAEDIADAIVYCATRPAHVDIEEMTIMPTAQASVHHLHKP